MGCATPARVGLGLRLCRARGGRFVTWLPPISVSLWVAFASLPPPTFLGLLPQWDCMALGLATVSANTTHLCETDGVS